MSERTYEELEVQNTEQRERIEWLEATVAHMLRAGYRLPKPSHAANDFGMMPEASGVLSVSAAERALATLTDDEVFGSHRAVNGAL
jgi:hypothetical protein